MKFAFKLKRDISFPCKGSLPSQTQDEFDDFLINFQPALSDIIASNPLFVLTTNDFNARAANWWRNDMTTTESTKIDSLTTSYFTIPISDLTHIFPYSSVYIDLIAFVQ